MGVLANLALIVICVVVGALIGLGLLLEIDRLIERRRAARLAALLEKIQQEWDGL